MLKEATEVVWQLNQFLLSVSVLLLLVFVFLTLLVAVIVRLLKPMNSVDNHKS